MLCKEILSPYLCVCVWERVYMRVSAKVHYSEFDVIAVWKVRTLCKVLVVWSDEECKEGQLKITTLAKPNLNPSYNKKVLPSEFRDTRIRLHSTLSHRPPPPAFKNAEGSSPRLRFAQSSALAHRHVVVPNRGRPQEPLTRALLRPTDMSGPEWNGSGNPFRAGWATGSAARQWSTAATTRNFVPTKNTIWSVAHPPVSRLPLSTQKKRRKRGQNI